MRRERLPEVLLLMALLSLPALATERILDFQSDIQVQADSSLVVHETIRVLSEGRSIRHGIFREFPTTYMDKAGNRYIVGFDLVDVRRDGQTETYMQQPMSNGVRIRIGNSSTELAPGEYTYELTYRAKRELGYFAGFDELYWNVTGIGWLFPIDKASATVTLPKPVPADQLRLAGYTGYQASHDQNLSITRINETQILFVTTVPLVRGQGLTIAVGFPKGIVAEPTAAQRAAYFVADNATAGTVFIGLFVVLVYYAFAWLLVGQDPRRGVIVVRYEPPPQLSPAAMSFLRHMGYNQRVFVSAAVDLAVKGYLKIEQEGSVYSLTRLKQADSSLPAEEVNLLRILFNSSPEIDLTQLESPTIGAATRTLTNDLNLEENQKLFQKNWGWVSIGALLSVLTLIAMVFTLAGPNRAVAGFLSVWLTGWSAAVIALIGAAVKAWKKFGAATIMATIFALVFASFEALALFFFSKTVGTPAAAGLALLLITNAAFVHLLRTLTPAGRELMDQIEGFKQFLTMVDSDRLQRVDAPARTPALFEKCLPYALALGVEQVWAKQFESVLAQAATATGGSVGYAPIWFSGDSLTGFSTGEFASSFSSGFSSAVSSASSSPGSSSGSGGGGSSGGGGGGGGGGGW
jgi:uncharacterized membrane protein YgcG